MPRGMSVIDVPRQEFGAALSALNLDHWGTDGAIDPFLVMTVFRMSGPVFPPHPHAGFAVATYVFDDSRGAMSNRDTIDGSCEIRAGELRWTDAGRGFMHEEVPAVRGCEVHGLQLFVNVPQRHKHAEPRGRHFRANELPESRPWAGVNVRVLCGTSGGVASPVVTRAPTTLIDVHMQPGSQCQHELPAGHTAVIFVVAGDGVLGDARETLRVGIAAVGRPDGPLRVTAGEHGLQYLFGNGTPLAEPVHARGPFIMSRVDDLDRAESDWSAGRMGTLEASF